MISFFLSIFSWLPNLFVHILVIIGLVGFLISILVPLKTQEVLLVKFGSIALLIVGIYLEGGLSVTEDYKRREKEWANKIAIVEQKAEAVSAKVEYVFLDRIKEIQSTQVVVQERIKNVSINMDKDCKISADVIDIHNQAAKGKRK